VKAFPHQGGPECTGSGAGSLLSLFIALFFISLSSQAARTPIVFDRPAQAREVGFQREILPVLQANCLPCHNQTRAKAGLNLETPALMIRGGDSGPSIIPGNAAASLLLKSAAHEVDDLEMPPADNKANARTLTATELSLLWSWINQGARSDLAADSAPNWNPIPTNWNSSFALALTSDGRLAAVGRANRLVLLDVASGKETARITDPTLDGAAQRDVICALAFSPDDQILAAAGFREVRLWKRQPVVVTNASPVPEDTQWIAAVPSPPVPARFSIDPQPALLAVRLSRELALSKVEEAYANGLIPPAEAAEKAATEALAKLKEKQAEHARAHAEKEKEVTREKEVEATSTRERDELGAELERITQAADTAAKAVEASRTAARAAADSEASAEARASLARQLRDELDRLLAQQTNSVPSPALAPLREALTAANADLESIRAEAGKANAAVSQALEALATTAFNAGQRKAGAERALSEIPPRRKQAEERLAAAQKALGTLHPQLEKLRITLDGSTQDVALAERSLAAAAHSLADAKAALATARGRIASAESSLKEAQHAAAEIATRVPAFEVASSDGSQVLVLGPDGAASCWDPDNGSPIATFHLGHSQPLAVATVGPSEFVVAFPTHIVRINASRPWLLHRVLGGQDSIGNARLIDRVNALAFSPDGRLLATGGGEPSRSGELKIWDAAEGTVLRDLENLHSDCVTSLAFSPRGEWLASGGADRFARISHSSTNAPTIHLEGHTHHVLGVAWTPDGSTIASAGAEGAVKLWNPMTGERRRNIDGFSKEITGLQSVALTNQFVAVGGNGRGRIFRADGEKVRDLAVTSEYLQAFAVTPDGETAIGADDHGRVTFWSLATGEIRPAR